MEWAGIEVEELERMSGQEVKRKIAERVEREWSEGISEKSTLWLYREFKREMKEEDYAGGEKEKIWFQARTNCLRLGDRRREEGCVICRGMDLEDLLHFVLDCWELEEERRGVLELQRPRVEQRQTVVGEFLFRDEGRGRKSEILMKMWRKRRMIERREE